MATRLCYRPVSFLLIITLAGCQLVTPPAVVPSVDTTTLPPRLSVKEQRINQLLTEARVAFEANRLTTPVDDNAYLRYTQVLAMDESNAAALLGLSEIVEKYLSWALDHLAAGNLASARRYVGTAQSVDPLHPNLAAVQARLNEAVNSREVSYDLPVRDLSNRADWLVGRLLEIGREVQRRNARVIITARSDAEGRWIYQQLNLATPERVRGTFQIDNIPSVKLIFSQDNPPSR